MHGSTLVYTYIKTRRRPRGTRAGGDAPRPPGPGQGHPRTTRDPLRPAQSHPRATQDHAGRPKSRQEGFKGRQEGSKRAPGGARRPPGAPKNYEKRYTVDEIRLFSRKRFWSRPAGSKSRPGGAKSASGAAQEPPRAPQGGPRAAKICQERPRGRPGQAQECTWRLQGPLS